MNIDWDKWLRDRFNVVNTSRAYKCVNYSIQVGDGLIHWTLVVNIGDKTVEGYKFYVSIVGQNNPQSKLISNFKDKVKESFTINNTNVNNVFHVSI